MHYSTDAFDVVLSILSTSVKDDRPIVLGSGSEVGAEG